jgi:hypothetical protein
MPLPLPKYLAITCANCLASIHWLCGTQSPPEVKEWVFDMEPMQFPVAWCPDCRYNVVDKFIVDAALARLEEAIRLDELREQQ